MFRAAWFNTGGCPRDAAYVPVVPSSSGVISCFIAKNCFRSPNVRNGALPSCMALVKGTTGLGLGFGGGLDW
jgi:hypothetical protein